MAVIEKRPGVWELRVYRGKDPLTNKPKWAVKTWHGTRRKRDAEKACADYARRLDGLAVGSQSTTMLELLERWWRFGVDQELWSPGVELKHREWIDGRFKPLHDKRVVDVRTIDLDEYYAALRARGGRNGKPLAASTVVRIAGALALALDQAVRWEIIDTNPARNAQPGRVKRKKVAGKPTEQILQLIAAAEDRDPEWLCFVFLDAEVGARRGELGALRLDDFDDDTVTISRALAIGLASPQNAARYAGHYWPSDIKRGRGELTALIEKTPKTDESVRTVALAPETLKLVDEQAARLRARSAAANRVYPADGFLFPALGCNGDRPLRPDTWTRRFAKLRSDVGLTGIRLHDIRHYVISTLLHSGIDLATVAGRAGHGGGGKTTLSIYGHPSDVVDRAASAVMAELLKDARKKTTTEDAKVVQLRAKKSS